MKGKPLWVGIVDAHPIDIVGIHDVDQKSMVSKSSIGWFVDSYKRGDLFFVARNRITGDVVGFIDGKAVPPFQNLDKYIPSYFFISRLAVDEKHRNVGIGTSLVTKLEESAKKLGYSGMVAGVRASNDSALSFYDKLGYEIDTDKSVRWVYDYGETNVERRRRVVVKKF